MSAIFKYNKEKGCLEEQIDKENNPDYKKDCTCFLCVRRRDSLRSYPTSFKEWPEGDLVEGEHFYVKEVYVEPPPDIHCNRGSDVPTAFPLSSSQPKEESDEDELWKHLLLLITVNYKINGCVSLQGLNTARQNYKLTKRI